MKRKLQLLTLCAFATISLNANSDLELVAKSVLENSNEITILKDRVIQLEQENQLLKQKVNSKDLAIFSSKDEIEIVKTESNHKKNSYFVESHKLNTRFEPSSNALISRVLNNKEIVNGDIVNIDGVLWLKIRDMQYANMAFISKLFIEPKRYKVVASRVALREEQLLYGNSVLDFIKKDEVLEIIGITNNKQWLLTKDSKYVWSNSLEEIN